MEFKLNRETVPAAELIYSGVQEQGVELDYILPDYCPDIFRLVRCDLIPVVTGSTLSGDRLTYELQCGIRLIYCSENSDQLQCISQQQTFTKTVELGKIAENGEAELEPKPDHVNFRAVNKRRLDVRGAVSVKVTVTGEKQQEVISDAFGMNIQLKKVPVKYAAKKLTGEKLVQLSEETELTPAQPPVIAIIREKCTVSRCEHKLVSGKLLAKGEVTAELLYTCGDGVEPMSFTMPFSQILDIDGIDETFECALTAEVLSCPVTVTADKDGENRLLKFEPELRIRCRGVKPSELMVAADAYSTVYPCETETEIISAGQLPEVYRETLRHSAKIAEGDSLPQTVYAMWCTPKNLNTRLGSDGRSVILSGMLTYSMAAKDASGMMVMPDRDEAFEETVTIGDDLTGSDISAKITDVELSYNIGSDGVLTARAELTAEISAGSTASVRALTGITVDDTVKKQRDGDYAIKLYFGVENEDIWDIAKRCSTEMDAIIEENDLTSGTLEKGRMLLIPIKD